MNANLLILIIILVFSPLAQAGKLYKIVDENGKVTFSQVPPRKGADANSKVEEVKVDTGAKTRVTTEFGKSYCGEIQLPSQSEYHSSSAKYHSRNVANSLASWKESLTRIGENRERRNQDQQRYNSYYRDDARYQNQKTARYQEEYTRDTQNMRDLRCAIDWAENQQDKITEYEAADEQERARLIEVARQLKVDLEELCGKQPVFDPTDQGNEYKRKRWYNCSKDIMRDLNKVRQRLDHI